MKNVKEIYNYEAVSRLSLILNYELSASVFFFMSWAYSFTLVFAIIAATVFAPYMLYVLYREKRIGWIFTFIILHSLPFVPSMLFGMNSLNITTSLFVALGIFYFYCFIIKLVVKDWIKDYNWKQHLAEQKREREINNELLEMKFNTKIKY